MSSQNDIAAAMQRAENVFTRRPDMGLHDDASARVAWHGGTRMTVHHALGVHMDTDMPRELGGSGDCVSPGWLFRAGIASCNATAITMVAARQGIELDQLEIIVGSRSDTRGLLGMQDASGDMINPGPVGITLEVRIGARGVDHARLRALVEEGLRRSPIQNALVRDTPLTVSVLLDEHAAA